MYVTKIQYEGYRNLKDDYIQPDKGIHVIYGENAQGKTNLLEAFWLFTGGHSFRGTKDGEIPRINPESGKSIDTCKLYLDFYSEGRQQKAKLIIQNGKRSSVINGVEKKSGTPLVGKVCAVIFSPEHLQLVKSGPAMRRNFIDGAICQIKPGYAKMLSTYKKIILQRNTLLKEISRNSSLLDTLDIWDMRLAKYGAYVMIQRREYINRLSSNVIDIYRGISRNREEISIGYQPSVSLSFCDISGSDSKDGSDVDEAAAEVLVYEALQSSKGVDLRTGHTSAGPHRDDLIIEINSVSARMYASQGQQRSAVLAMKLAESQILQEETGETPLILLDDVMSELDTGRQDYLLNHLRDRQVFITCCAPETVRLMEQGKRYLVEKGVVCEK